MLRRVVKVTYYQPLDRKISWNYRCYYTGNAAGWRGDRRRVYTWQEQLPKTVVDFVLNGVCVNTEYVTDRWGLPVKYETFLREGDEE